jgi:hypothetical protein
MPNSPQNQGQHTPLALVITLNGVYPGGVRTAPVPWRGTHEYRPMVVANKIDLQPLSVRLPTALRDALAAQSKAENEPISVIIRRACRLYIEREGIQV